MGRKAGSLYMNPKKFSNISKPCMKEMVSFLNCIALNHNNDDKCTRQKDLLNTCMDAQVTLLLIVDIIREFCLLFIGFFDYFKTLPCVSYLLFCLTLCAAVQQKQETLG